VKCIIRYRSSAGNLPPSYDSMGRSDYNPWQTGSQLSDERTPFNPPFYVAMPSHPMPSKKRGFWCPIILAGLLTFMLGCYCQCGYDLDGTEHDSVHRRWNWEEANHEAKRQEWVKEEEEHGVRKKKMHRETMVWEERKADAIIRWEVARENLQDAQQRWAEEKVRHDCEPRRTSLAWERRTRKNEMRNYLEGPGTCRTLPLLWNEGVYCYADWSSSWVWASSQDTTSHHANCKLSSIARRLRCQSKT